MTKACRRPDCDGVITERYPSQLARRTYCSWRCVQWASRDARQKGQESASIRRAVASIHKALGITTQASPSLVRAVRKIRAQAYRSGWTVVQRRLQRAVKRGVLVRAGERWVN